MTPTEKPPFAYNAQVAAIHKLRINLKSLTAEARIIRQEVRRCGPLYREQLTEHRRGRLREEARYTHLALAFLRGRKYRAVEHEGSRPVDAKRLADKLGRATNRLLASLLLEAEAWLK